MKHSIFQFYVLENNLELYARFMLFMAVTLEAPDRMGLQGQYVDDGASETKTEALGPVYTKRQPQRRVNTVMALAILVSLKTIKTNRATPELDRNLFWS